jgi:hypothetical protein
MHVAGIKCKATVVQLQIALYLRNNALCGRAMMIMISFRRSLTSHRFQVICKHAIKAGEYRTRLYVNLIACISF